MALTIGNGPTKDSESLNGKFLRFTSIHSPPSMIFPESESKIEKSAINPSEFTGICFEIINILKEHYNFSFIVESPADGEFGAKQNDGSWSGMMGMILKNQSDMAIGPFAITVHRNEVVDFATNFHQSIFSILTPSPTEDNRLWAALRPFQLTVWLLLIFTMAILPFITWLSHKWIIIRGGLRDDQSSFMNQLKSVFGILLTQSGQRIPNRSRTLGFLWTIWCLSSVILIYAYVGSITSFLSVPKLKPLIRSIYDLPDSSFSSFRLLIAKGSSMESIFMEATEGIYGYIGERLRENREWIMEESLAVAAVAQSSNSFFLHAQSRIDYLAEQHYKSSRKCQLSRAKLDYFKVNSAFVVPKGSLLKDIFNQKILQMIDSGLMNYWIRKFRPSIKECQHIYFNNGQNKLSSNNKNTARSLTMVDLQSTFLILGLGTALAFISLLFEFVIFHFTRLL